MEKVTIFGLMTTLKMLVENFNKYSCEYTMTGSELALGAKEATLTAISYLSDDLKVNIEFGTEYADNGFGYTSITATPERNGVIK